MRLTQKHLSPVEKKMCWSSVRSSTCRSPGEQARMSAATLIPSTSSNESRHLAVDTWSVATHPTKGEALAYSPPGPSGLGYWRHSINAFHLVYVQPLPSSTTMPRHSTGSWPTSMESSCFTTWMTSCWLAHQARTPVPRRCPGCCWCVSCYASQ